MLNNEEVGVWTQPLEPHHVLEAMRRLAQRPASGLGHYRRLEARGSFSHFIHRHLTPIGSDT